MMAPTGRKWGHMKRGLICGNVPCRLENNRFECRVIGMYCWTPGFIWIISRSLEIEGAIHIREVSSNIASISIIFPAGSRFSQCSGFRNKTWYTPNTDPFTLEVWIWWEFLIAAGCRGEELIEGSNNITLWSSGRRSSNWASREIDVLNWIMYYANDVKADQVVN